MLVLKFGQVGSRWQAKASVGTDVGPALPPLHWLVLLLGLFFLAVVIFGHIGDIYGRGQIDAGLVTQREHTVRGKQCD